ISWTAPAGAQSYNIYRGTTADGEGGTPLVTAVADTTYVDSALTNGVTYYYKITAVNANASTVPAISSESAFSAEVSATPSGIAALLDFSGGFAGSTTKLTYNGSAAINGTKAEVTNGGANEAGSFFSTSRVDISQFSSSFTFQISAGA